MKKLNFTIFIIGFIVVYFISYYYSWEPIWALLLAYSFPFMLILVFRRRKSKDDKGYKFMQELLKGFYVRFVLSGIVLGVLLYYYKSIRYPVVGVFFISYILFTFLEIKIFLYTLRADSKKGEKS